MKTILTMMNNCRRPTIRLMLRALLLSALMLFSATAWSLNLGQAKAGGLVGETPSGYLRPVGSPTAEVKQLVARINAERRAVYERIAKKNGTSLKNVEALAGKKAIDKSAAGEYVFVGGAWKRK